MFTHKKNLLFLLVVFCSKAVFAVDLADKILYAERIAQGEKVEVCSQINQNERVESENEWNLIEADEQLKLDTREIGDLLHDYEADLDIYVSLPDIEYGEFQLENGKYVVDVAVRACSLVTGTLAKAVYSGKTANGTKCTMNVSEHNIEFYKGKGTHYVFRKIIGHRRFNHLETSLMSSSWNTYVEPIGAIITFFGIGVKKVVLQTHFDGFRPTDYKLEVEGLFNDIDCRSLTKVNQ